MTARRSARDIWERCAVRALHITLTCLVLAALIVVSDGWDGPSTLLLSYP